MAAKAKTATRAPPKAKTGPDLGRLLDDLTEALVRTFAMSPEDALAVAEIVAERFAGCDEVNDEQIDAEVRSLFYTLEARRLLSFRREEYDNEAGERRRAFYWRVRLDVLRELANPVEQAEEEDVYESLPEECWDRGSSEPAQA